MTRCVWGKPLAVATLLSILLSSLHLASQIKRKLESICTIKQQSWEPIGPAASWRQILGWRSQRNAVIGQSSCQ